MNLSLSLNIYQKFLGVSFIFAIPVGLLLYFMVSGINDDIEFARQEMRGTQVLQSLYALRSSLLQQSHSQTQLSPSNSVRFSTTHTDTQQPMSALFAQLEQGVASHAQALQLDTQGLRRTHLKPLKVLYSTWAEHGSEAVSDDIARWYQRVGDSSNLILDPDLDSYYLMDVLVLSVPASLDRVASILALASADLDADKRMQLQIHSAQLTDSLKQIQHSITTALQEDGRFYGASDSLQTNIPPALNEFANRLNALVDATHKLSTQATTDLDTNVLSTAANVFNSAARLWRTTREELDTLLEIRIAAYQDKRLWHVSLSVAVFMLALLAIYLVARNIAKRLATATHIASQVTAGDLTCEIRQTGQDEVGLLLKNTRRMIHELNALISQTQHSVLTVSASATQLAASAREQETVMQHQAESTQAVLTSSEYIVDTSQELAETISAVAELSNVSATMAQSGQTDLVRMRDAIHHMETASRSISAKLEQIHGKANSITSVVITITKVAEQTNLLSLNAAIEAEKAGEYGRGFTVVAQEIRRLADQTAVATLDIEEMVAEMQQAVASGVNEMTDFIHKVQLSVDDVDTVSDKLSGIIDRVKTLAPAFVRLQTGADAQLGHVHQIKDAMLNLNDETVQIVAALHESYLSIEQLNEAVASLSERIQHFKVR